MARYNKVSPLEYAADEIKALILRQLQFASREQVAMFRKIAPSVMVNCIHGILFSKERHKWNSKKLDSILAQPLEMLELPLRVMNIAWNRDFITIGELARTTEIDLLKNRNLGKTSLYHIKLQLGKLKLWLGMDVPIGPKEKRALRKYIKNTGLGGGVLYGVNHKICTVLNAELQIRTGREFLAADKERVIGILSKYEDTVVGAENAYDQAAKVIRAKIKEHVG